MIELFANSGDADQTLHFAASDLGLHCLPITPLGVSRLQWVKRSFVFIHNLKEKNNNIELYVSDFIIV